MKVTMTQLHTSYVDVLNRLYATSADVVRCYGRRVGEVQSGTLDATCLNGILRLEFRLVAASGVDATITEQ